MAVDKGKVLAKLEILLKGKSATKTYKDNLAAKWAEKIDTDEDIDTYITDREDIILESISEADRRATEASKKKEPAPQDTPPADDPYKDAPDWFKSHVTAQDKKIEDLKGELTGFQQKEAAKTLEQRFKSDERLKNVPEVLFKGRIPSKEDDFEAYVTELVTDAQALNIQNFGKDAPPAGGTGGGDGKVDNDIANFAKSQNENYVKSKI